MASLLCDVLARAGFETRASADAAAARQAIDDFDPDAAMIDINLGHGPSGLQLGHVIRRTHPHLGMVFLTKYQDPRVSGPDGWTVPEGSAFLSKDLISDTRLLMEAIESVLDDAAPKRRDDRGEPGPLAALTRTQLEILRLAALGLTNVGIARRRNTSERAVEQRLRSVYQALDIDITPEVNPRVEAVRRYMAAAGIPPADVAVGDDGE